MMRGCLDNRCKRGCYKNYLFEIIILIGGVFGCFL